MTETPSNENPSKPNSFDPKQHGNAFFDRKWPDMNQNSNNPRHTFPFPVSTDRKTDVSDFSRPFFNPTNPIILNSAANSSFLQSFQPNNFVIPPPKSFEPNPSSLQQDQRESHQLSPLSFLNQSISNSSSFGGSSQRFGEDNETITQSSSFSNSSTNNHLENVSLGVRPLSVDSFQPGLPNPMGFHTSSNPVFPSFTGSSAPMLPIPQPGEPFQVELPLPPTRNFLSLLPASNDSTPEGPMASASTSSGFLCEGLRSAMNSHSSTPGFLFDSGSLSEISDNSTQMMSPDFDELSESNLDRSALLTKSNKLYVARSELAVSIRGFDRFIYQSGLTIEPVGPYNPDYTASDSEQVYSPPASVCSVGTFCACVECRNIRTVHHHDGHNSTTDGANELPQSPKKRSKKMVHSNNNRSPYCVKKCQTRQQNLRQRRVAPKMTSIRIKRELLYRLSLEKNPRKILGQVMHELAQLERLVSNKKGISVETLIAMIPTLGKPAAITNGTVQRDVVQEALEMENGHSQAPDSSQSSSDMSFSIFPSSSSLNDVTSISLRREPRPPNLTTFPSFKGASAMEISTMTSKPQLIPSGIEAMPDIVQSQIMTEIPRPPVPVPVPQIVTNQPTSLTHPEEIDGSDDFGIPAPIFNMKSSNIFTGTSQS